MAKLTHAESRRLYSWWWDSHISPKNSKWLQENLTDMDIKVKSMIKLIEEDADSFARRAEMYYKKRPELMKLVEEFYRAYRALAERYDHATGALRQAQRTMAEAFPNQIPFALSEESPSASSATDAALQAPEMPPPFRSMFVSDDTHKDALHVPSQFHDIKRNGAYSEENEALTSKKGLKQLNGMFAEGRARKGLNSQDEGNGSECKLLQEEVSQIPRETQNLKGHVKSKSVRADDVEAAVHSLKETISNLESEKDAALLQHQLSLERISKMEAEISSCQEELKKLNDEMLMVVSKLTSAEERCLLLDTANRSLQLEVEMLKQRAKDQKEELSKKQEELENLNISIQDDRLRLEKLHSQSQEEGRVLALEVQRGIEKLKDMELSKLGLEEEIQKLTKDNGRLNEQILASAFEIISLQDEIILLKDSKVKLEDEVGVHVEEKRVLQQELSCLKEDKNDLEQRHCWLTEKIEAVNSNVESLQAMVKELQAGNAELKEICKKHEDEKVVHLESLKHMEKMSEKNVVLETSLSDANAEIESSIEKIKTLEESCRSLKGMISIHLSEKAALVSQVESIAQEMEKLSEGNTFLENSLSDVNVELEGLRVKSKVLEESCQSLYVQNFSLLSEKSTLVSQVERTIQSLENLENMYEDLEVRHLNLEREKDLPLRHMMELKDSFKREKEEYETLIMSIILSSKSQLSTLENQISLLQEEGRLREEEFELEQYEVLDAQIENFILQRCLRDTNENNSILSVACQKHLEESKCAEKVISDLKQELLAQEKKLTASSVRNRNLKVGIQLMLKELCANKDCESLDGIEDEILLQLTLSEIRGLLNSISDAQDENQHLLLGKSVIITILQQLGLNVMHLTMEKIALEQESKTRTEELSALQSKELELLERNEQLRQEFYDLREKANTLDEENSVVLAEVMTMEYLYLIFRSSSAEKALELQSLRSDLDSLCGAKNGLDQEIRLMNEKLASVEAENFHLEDDLHTTRDLCKQLNLEIESGKGLLAQKDIELLQENHRFLSIQDKNTESYKNLEVLQLDIERAMSVREELENKFFTLSKENAQRENEITFIRQENDKLHKEVEDHKAKEEQLIYDQQRGVDEVKSCEIEIETLLNGNHIATVNAAVFEEKVLELLIACEIRSMVQIATLHEELAVRNANMDESREKLASMEGENGSLKEELNAYLVLVTALWDDITSLEEHTLLLANHRTSNRREKQENLLAYFQHSKSSQEPRGNRSATLPAGRLELQKLRAKVKALQKLVVDTETLLEQDMFESNTNLEAALKEIELLKSKDIVMQLEKSEEPGADLKLQNGDGGISEVKYEQMMKDIQLDIVSSSSQHGNDVGSYRPSPTEKDGTNDRLFDSCKTAMEKASPVTSVHEIEYQIDAMEEVKTEYPSCELVSEKELSIDKLALPKKVTEYDRELKRGAIERLSSNAQRLSFLQTSVQELQRNMESSETTDFPTTSLEFDMVKAQLKEAEGAILQLVDTNRILTEKAEQCSPSADSPVVKQNEKRNKIRRQVSERARRGSEKIGRLELDLQKIQYILLQLKEEHVNRRAKATDKRRVLLKDYLYGTVDSRRQKKRPSCCMIPKTKDD